MPIMRIPGASMKGGRNVDRSTTGETPTCRPSQSPPVEGSSQGSAQDRREKSITDVQLQIASLYGFASWPKLRAHVESFEEIGQLKQAIDTNDIVRVKTWTDTSPLVRSLRSS